MHRIFETRSAVRAAALLGALVSAAVVPCDRAAAGIVVWSNGSVSTPNTPSLVAADEGGFVAAAAPILAQDVVVADGDAALFPSQMPVLSTVPPPAIVTGFGSSIARSGGVVAIGEPLGIGGAGGGGGSPVTGGVVRLYEPAAEGAGSGGWTQTAIVEAPEPFTSFGSAIALADDRLVVGAPFTDVKGVENAGAVYVYERIGNEWVPLATIVAPVPQQQGLFGHSVAAHGSRFAVGAPGFDLDAGSGTVESAGAIWVLQLDGLGTVSVETVITSPAPLPFDGLGSSLSLAEEIVVGGMPTSGHVGPNRGAAVVAVRSGDGEWPTTLLVPGAGAPAVRFGSHVLAGNGSVLVSTAAGTELGWARRFHAVDGLWIADSAPNLRGSIAAWGRRVVAADIGAISVFPIDMTCPSPITDNDCDGDFLADDCAIASGDALDRNGDGTPDGCPDVRVALVGAAAGGGSVLDNSFFAQIAADGLRVAVRPFWRIGTSLDGGPFQWVDFGTMAAEADELPPPTQVGWIWQIHTVVVEPSWLAVASVTNEYVVDVLEQTKGAPPNVAFSVSADLPITGVGAGLASTPSLLLLAASSGSDAGIIKRLERGDDGSWTELAPIEIPRAGPNTGLAIGVSPHSDGTGMHVLAVADATPADDQFEGGRVRIFALAPSGEVTEEASIRLPRWAFSPRQLGRDIVADGDRVVTTWTSFGPSIRGVLVHRRAPDGVWHLEAELPVSSTTFGWERSYSIAATGSQIALSVAGDGIQRFVRHANGSWIERDGLACGVKGWRFGGGVAFLDDGRLAVLARKAWSSSGSELWALDPIDDCNENGIGDRDEIAGGAADKNSNGLLDACEPAGDLDLDGVVGPADLALLLGRWGGGPGLGDLTDDGVVDGADLGKLLAGWGGERGA